MRIAKTAINRHTGVYTIYLAGCLAPRCPDCPRPQYQDFRRGVELTLDELIWQVEDPDNKVHRIVLTGGEPLDQHPEQLLKLLLGLKSTTCHITVRTKYQFGQVPTQYKTLIDVLRCGRYDPTQLINDGAVFNQVAFASLSDWRESANQQLYYSGYDYCIEGVTNGPA